MLQRNKWIDGTYYVDGNGAMMVNTRTPDGYLVGADGKWIKETQPQTTNAVVNNKVAVKGNGSSSSSISDSSDSGSGKDYSRLSGSYTSSSGAQIDINASEDGYIDGYFYASEGDSEAEGSFSGQLSGSNSISFTVDGYDDYGNDTTDTITITFSSLKGNSLTATRSGYSGNDALDSTMGNGKSVKFKQ